MRVLLVYPPKTLLPFEMEVTVPPLGLAYIAAYLRERLPTVAVAILDAVAEGADKPAVPQGGLKHFGLPWEEIKERITRFQPDVVGISCLFSSQSRNAHKVAGLVKQYAPQVPVVFGGAHPSSVPQAVLADPNVDVVIVGEGEVAFHLLVDQLARGQPEPAQVPGAAFRNGDGGLARGPANVFIQDLDSLPLPARDLLPMHKYVLSGQGPQLMRKPYTTVVTSRACPFNCVFCSIHNVWGWKWRGRSAENVVAEIEHLVSQYGIREIHFEDDNLTFRKQRMLDICRLIQERGIDITWTTPNGVYLQTLDEELLRAMKRSGCYCLSFGIESGDPDTLKFIGKPISLERARKVIHMANRVGIWTEGFFVIGFPHEDAASIRRTLDFAKNSGLDFASFAIATPLPGTRLYQIMVEQGMIDEASLVSGHYEALRTMHASVGTRFLRREELDQLQVEMYSSFIKHRLLTYAKPGEFFRALRKVRGKESLGFTLRLARRALQIRSKGKAPAALETASE